MDEKARPGTPKRPPLVRRRSCTRQSEDSPVATQSLSVPAKGYSDLFTDLSCLQCHSRGKYKGGLSLENGATLDDVTYSWQDLGLGAGSAGVASTPDAAAWQQSRLDVVWKDSQSHVAHWYWDDVNPPGGSGFNLWSGGAPPGVQLNNAFPPAIAALGDNRLNVIVATQSGQLWLSPWLDGVQQAWTLGPNGNGITYGDDIATW